MTDHDSSQTDNEHDPHADKPSYDDVNMPVVIMVGLVSIVFTVITIALVQGIYNHWSSAIIDEVQYSRVDQRREAMVQDQLDQLDANDKGRISIDEAMQQTLKEYRESN